MKPKYHEDNYCRELIVPKIAKPSSQASHYNRASPKIGINHFHLIKLQSWIYEDKTLDL
jgi:hypothetical protein